MKFLVAILLIDFMKSNLTHIPCFVDEKENTLGKGKCQVSVECKGERKCNLMGFCFGEDNCKAERKLGELYFKSSCNVTENENKCDNHFDCQGDRQCVENKCMG